MKKRMLALLLLSALTFAFSGCGEKSLLDQNEPVTLNFWHVYGEQSGSPMDLLVQEFNRTVGQEKGVRVQVTNLSSASKIGGYLKEAQAGGGDAPEMPDLFTCHIGDATALGVENLVDWNEWFTQEELSDFVPGFLEDGTAEDGELLIFPVSKSTQLLMCNGSGFARFSGDTGAGYDDLSTWEGFTIPPGSFMIGRAASLSARWIIPSVPWNFAPWSAAAGSSTPKTAGMTRATPYSKRVGCSLPARWRRGMWWCPIFTPTRRS